MRSLALIGCMCASLACSFTSPEPEPEPVPAAPPPKIVTVSPPAEPAGADGGGTVVSGNPSAVPVQLRFSGVSGLHQGFFMRDSGLRGLGQGLATCTEHAVAVDVVWNQEELEGRLVAEALLDSSTCAPRAIDDGIDVRELTSLSRAVAAYRDDVAGRSDFRIANFKVAVDAVALGTVCRFRAAGQHPPDGTSFDRCIRIGGERVCADALEDQDGYTRLRSSDPAVVRSLQRCVGKR